MKQLIVIIGPNGVGKTTTAKKIVEQYENIYRLEICNKSPIDF